MKKQVDMRDLLIRYIKHVGDCEGVTYITSGYIGKDDEANFSTAEWAILRQLEKEARK